MTHTHFPYYVSIEDIIQQIMFEDSLHIPKIIISVASVRSGTTATLRLFGESGIKSYRQPFKSIYRKLAQEKERSSKMPMWIIPKDEIIYVKETLGPHNIYESSLNPLEIFFQLFKRILSDQYSGTKLTTKVIEMMQSKICLIIMGRQPVEAWSSNLATYTKLIRSGNLKDNPYYSSSEEELLKNFIAAYQWVNKIRKIAIDLSIPLHHYMYEANQYAETSIPALFKKLQIKQLPKINGWTDQSVVGNKNSNVFIISDFTNQKKANLHDTLDNSNGIQYFPRNIDQVSDQIKQIIQKSGLHEIYNQWKNETEKELEITLSKKVNR